MHERFYIAKTEKAKNLFLRNEHHVTALAISLYLTANYDIFPVRIVQKRHQGQV